MHLGCNEYQSFQRQKEAQENLKDSHPDICYSRYIFIQHDGE